MRKSILFLLILLFTIPAAAQIELQWQKSVAGGNLPSWFSTANNERGFAFNPVTNKLYIVSRNGGTFVKVVSAVDGSDLGDLDVTGITGGTFTISDINVSTDGIVYAANLVSASTGPFKIYRWANEAAAPTVAFSGLEYSTKRVGDNFTVVGSAANNTLQVWFADATNNKIYRLTTADNGATLSVADSVVLPAGTFGGHASVYPIIEGNVVEAIIVNSSGKNATAYNTAGQLIGTISGGVLATGSTTVKVSGMYRTGYLASFQFGAGNENARVIELMGDSAAYFRTYAISSSLGTNANANGSGDIDFRKNPDGSLTMFVLGTNNGFGAYKITTPFIMNGRLHENYTFAAGKLNSNSGFGNQINIKDVFYAFDDSLFYLALETKVNGGSNDGVAFFLDFSHLTGTAAGQPLGGVTNGGHLFGATDNPNFKMGFEVDYAFAFNPGGSSDTTVYVDGAKYIGGKTGQYLGSIRGGGATTFGPSTAGIFPANSLKMGYDNWEGHGRGFEISIPRSELGNLPSSATVRVFAVVVSSTAYFSDVTVPGNVTGGNLGFNANFGTISGGPYYSNPLIVPVELTSFAALSVGSDVVLNWSTATETNNKGFSIERSIDGSNFSFIGFVNGKGQSAAPVKYNFTDRELQNGTYYYRLRQIDFDGTSTLSNAVKVEVTGVPTKFELTQNYPNPFNPSTVIRFTVDKTQAASLVVFNALGEEVATLFNGIAKAGDLYQVDFSAKNLTSGIYFYTLKQGQNSVTRKMMMVK